MLEICLTGTEWIGEEKDLQSTQTAVKLTCLTHNISSGQSTFLPAFYDPISFVIFPLYTCCLTHSKTKLPQGLEANPSSCPASVNHL